jgi:hypothetical protein
MIQMKTTSGEISAIQVFPVPEQARRSKNESEHSGFVVQVLFSETVEIYDDTGLNSNESKM